MDTFAVINKNVKNQLVVRLIDATSRATAVRMRANELGDLAGNIMLVSNLLPSEFGRGGAMLYAVDVRPVPPMPQPPYEISIAGMPASAANFDDSF